MNKAFISFALILACANAIGLRQEVVDSTVLDSTVVEPEIVQAPSDAEAIAFVTPMTLPDGEYALALEYGFKYGDICKMCYPGCYLWKQYNNKCDQICNFASCNFDNGHCKPNPWSHY